MKALLLILLLAVTVAAQNTNGHAGAVITGSSGLGFSGASYGATAGADYRSGSFVFDADGQVRHVRKTVGGSGHDFSIEADAGSYVKPRLALIGTVLFNQYNVQAFSKSSTFIGGGVRYGNGPVTVDGEYLRDIQSQNKQNVFRLRATGYTKHHIFVRGVIQVQRFTSGGIGQTGVGVSGVFGFYFGGHE